MIHSRKRFEHRAEQRTDYALPGRRTAQRPHFGSHSVQQGNHDPILLIHYSV